MNPQLEDQEYAIACILGRLDPPSPEAIQESIDRTLRNWDRRSHSLRGVDEDWAIAARHIGLELRDGTLDSMARWQLRCLDCFRVFSFCLPSDYSRVRRHVYGHGGLFEKPKPGQQVMRIARPQVRVLPGKVTG